MNVLGLVGTTDSIWVLFETIKDGRGGTLKPVIVGIPEEAKNEPPVDAEVEKEFRPEAEDAVPEPDKDSEVGIEPLVIVLNDGVTTEVGLCDESI